MLLHDDLGAADAVQVGSPGKPVVVTLDYGLFPFWMSADTSKAPDYYRWQTVNLGSRMNPTPPPPDGSFSTVSAANDAMRARKTGPTAAQQEQAILQAEAKPWNLFPAPDMSPVPAKTPWAVMAAQMGISPSINATNWGPRALAPVKVPFYQRPLVWVAAGTVVALGALLLARRKK
jgi:hypothetical protein